MDDVVWTVAEASKYLKISPSLAYEKCHSGEIPTIRYNKRMLIPVNALLKRLNGDTETS